jgi:hypothetical protein
LPVAAQSGHWVVCRKRCNLVDPESTWRNPTHRPPGASCKVLCVSKVSYQYFQ